MLDDFALKVSYLTGFLIVLPLLVSRYLRLTGDPVIDAIPTVGFSDPNVSYLSAVRFAFDGAGVLNEGFKKVLCLSICPFKLRTLTAPNKGVGVRFTKKGNNNPQARRLIGRMAIGRQCSMSHPISLAGMVPCREYVIV